MLYSCLPFYEYQCVGSGFPHGLCLTGFPEEELKDSSVDLKRQNV